jgi:hypothetical protein
LLELLHLSLPANPTMYGRDDAYTQMILSIPANNFGFSMYIRVDHRGSTGTVTQDPSPRPRYALLNCLSFFNHRCSVAPPV